MILSQNGWPVEPPRRSRTIPGTGVAVTVADGPAGDVLMHVLAQIDARVEDIDLRSTRGEFDDWGYANRNVRGSASISNHASATAVDVNATRHPLGAENTFNQHQVDEIHRILGEVGGVVRWGGDYAGRVDEMHFEIVGNFDQVAQVARLIREANDMSWTPNDFLTQELWHDYGTVENAKAHGLTSGTVEKHKLGEWMTVGFIRAGLSLAEQRKQTALLTEIRDALQDRQP